MTVTLDTIQVVDHVPFEGKGCGRPMDGQKLHDLLGRLTIRVAVLEDFFWTAPLIQILAQTKTPSHLGVFNVAT